MAIQFLRGTSQQRAVSTYVLSSGQPFYETDTNKQYIGDNHTQLCDLKPVSGNNSNIENSIGGGSLRSAAENGTEDTRASGTQAIAFGKGCVAESSRALSLQRGNRVSEYITGYFYDASGAKILDSYLSESAYSYATYDPQTGKYTSTAIALDDSSKETLFTTMGGGTGANACSAFGQLQQIAGNCSVAFGKQNKIYVNGAQSFVCGLRNRLDSYQSVVFGRDNSAIDGRYSQFIFGRDNVAKHDDATLIGLSLKSSPLPQGSTLIRPQTVVGRFNNEDTDALFIVGSGFSNDNRDNAFTVTTYGAYVKGALSVNDYVNDKGVVQATGIKINGKPVATELYADEKSGSALNNAKSYTDSKINSLDVNTFTISTSSTDVVSSVTQTNGKISITKISIPTIKDEFTGSISDDSIGFVKGSDVYTALDNKADKGTKLSEYGIDDAYTKTQVDLLFKSAFKWDASSGILTIDSTKIGE